MRFQTLAIAAVLAASAATPALAANWDRIDTVSISPGDRDSVSPDFGGSVERLRFTARESGIECRAINAVLGNGQRVKLFEGRISEGSSKVIDLPGARHSISKLNFRCHPVGRQTSRLVIEADAGRYRTLWLRSPNWARLWGAVVANVDQNVNYWVSLGHETFTGRNDRETTFAGWGGRSVNSIGLRAVNDDAVCTSVVARFGNGTTRALKIDGGDLLREDRTYRIDLPGGERNVVGLALKCHAVHFRSVTIDIFANK